ncbi:hypothetical protein WDW37_16165 [Bdellovibrionota bacterium FG-1]
MKKGHHADTESASSATVLKKFNEVWQSLFSSHVHLDSALSKLPRNTKTTVAQMMPPILLRPVSQAEVLGVGMVPGEPWSLDPQGLAHWRSAQLLGERLYHGMSQRLEMPEPQPADFPPRMIQEWESAWGHATALKLVNVLGQEPPLSLRASKRLGAAALLKGLAGGSQLPVRAQVSEFAPFGVRLSGYAAILGSDLFHKGMFEIQDEGSQLMALFALWPEIFGPLLSESPGPVTMPLKVPQIPQEVPAWNVVDACAGAGGKSLAIADALGGKGRIYAYDTSAPKLQALRRRATRAGVTNIQTVQVREGQESEAIGRFKRRAHVVLVDAPCTGWGVLRRNPDIKWRQDPSVLERMPEIQLRLLSEYSQLVAGSGRLVFGVCTFRLAETREVVDRFLRAHPEFEAGPGGFFGPGPTDGFFMQCLTRRGQ